VILKGKIMATLILKSFIILLMKGCLMENTPPPHGGTQEQRRADTMQ
jgi:hypothetical protein